MNKNSIIKRLILLSTLSAISVATVVAATSQITNKKPQNNKKTTKKTRKNANGSNLKKENKNATDVFDPTDAQENLEKLTAEISKNFENKISFDGVGRQHFAFGNIDFAKYIVHVNEIVSNEVTKSVYLTVEIVHRVTRNKSKTRTLIVSGFSSNSESKNIKEQVKKVMIDYKDKQNYTSLSAQRSLIIATGHNDKVYRVIPTRIVQNKYDKNAIDVNLFIQEGMFGINFNFKRTIYGFKSLDDAKPLNDYAKTLKVDVTTENKADIDVTKHDLYSLDIVSNTSSDYKFIIKDLKPSPNQNSLEITYAVSKHGSDLQSDPMTVTIDGFKKVTETTIV